MTTYIVSDGGLRLVGINVKRDDPASRGWKIVGNSYFVGELLDTMKTFEWWKPALNEIFDKYYADKSKKMDAETARNILTAVKNLINDNIEIISMDSD